MALEHATELQKLAFPVGLFRDLRGRGGRLHQREDDRGRRGTGTEQLLLTGTWDDRTLPGRFPRAGRQKVFVDPQFISTVADKDYVVTSIRRTMAEQGVLLENNKDKAQVILEPSFGAYGTDMRDTNVGLPGMSLMPSLTTGATVASSGSSSSLNLSQTNREDAVVKAILYAYDVKSGRLVWESGWLLNAQGRARSLLHRRGALSHELAGRGRALPRRVAGPDPQAFLPADARSAEAVG